MTEQPEQYEPLPFEDPEVQDAPDPEFDDEGEK